MDPSYVGKRHGRPARYVKLLATHAPGIPGTFPRHHGLAISTCITARAARATMHAGIAN